MCKSYDIVFHFNKKHLEDSRIPMWVVKCKGESHYVHHVNVDKGVGFSTKETPDNPHTFDKIMIFIIKYNIMSKKKTTEEFVNEAIKKHGNKYGYSNVIYKTNRDKVQIECYLHGPFYITPNDHLSKLSGCPFCAGKNKTIENFITKAKKVHGNKYSYDKSQYLGVDSNIVITCPKHGDFNQTPYTHTNGSGCKKCSLEKLSCDYRLSNEEFVDKAKKIHGDKYTYNSKYETGKTKIKISCPIHGEFLQLASSHLNGRGCPLCKESKGEKTIRLWLLDNNIIFIPQYKFDKCFNHKTKRKLPFDFYLPDFNICIEFQGKQHYSIKHGGFGASPENTLTNFEKLKVNDNIKKEFCFNNNIELLEIPYYENIIESLSIKFKGVLHLTNEGDMIIANITNE